MSNQSSVKRPRSFQQTLQPVIKLDDQVWSYNVSRLPNSAELSCQGLVKSISVVFNDERQCITLKLEQAPQNRVASVEHLEHFILISFADFRIRCPSKTNPNVTEAGSARQSADYIIRRAYSSAWSGKSSAWSESSTWSELANQLSDHDQLRTTLSLCICSAAMKSSKPLRITKTS